jgi:hypothetical protein
LYIMIFAGPGMAEAPGKDPLGSSTKSDTDGESPDTERLNRRIRREQRKAERPEIINETILHRSDSGSEQSHDDVEDCAERLWRINTEAGDSSYSNKNKNVPFMLPKKLTVPLNGTGSRIPFALQKQMPADLYGIKDHFPVENPSGINVPVHAIPSDAAPEQSNLLDSSYNSVHSLRKIEKTNPNCRGGFLTEKIELGSFANQGDERTKLCHTRFLVDKKHNISFSFDPESMMCFSCGGAGMLSARKGVGGGGGSASFSPIRISRLHCLVSKGSVRKSFALRTGQSLSWCSAGSTSPRGRKFLLALC